MTRTDVELEHLVPRLDQSAPDIDAMWDIIEQAFPPAERRAEREFREIAATLPEGYFVRPIKKAGEVCGVMLGAELKAGEDSRFNGLVFVENLAVRQDFRNQGIGAQAMSRLLDELVSRDDLSPDTLLVLEVDLPGTDEFSERRISFYERLGLRLSPEGYVLPPIHPDGKPMALGLMTRTLGGPPSELAGEDFKSVVEALHRTVYGLDEPIYDLSS